MPAGPAESAFSVPTLVIDDDHFSRQHLAKALQHIGYCNVIAAESGEDALRKIGETDQLGLVFCDLMMPEIDGIQTLRSLAERFPQVRVIILSAAEQRVLRSARNMAQSFGLRSLGVLAKPATVDKVKAAIAELPAITTTSKKPLGVGPSLETAEFKRALLDGAIIAYFQPKVEIARSKVVGVEALVRWRHPVYGVLSPGVFLPLAQQSESLELLTEIVLGEAVAHAASWSRRGVDVSVAVNIPLATLGQPGVVAQFERAVAAQNLSPDRLVLEVTEDGWLQESGWARESLTRLRMAGFGLAIDDFGTGYSTIQQLLNAPFNEIKIDQSFVRAAMADRDSAIVLSSTIAMGHELDLKVVAEGVETQAQWDKLEELGCDQVQGYYVAPPMAGDLVVDWVNAWRHRLDARVA